MWLWRLAFDDRWVAAAPPDARWRARAVVWFAAAVAPWGAVFAAVFALLGLWPLAASLALAAVGVGSAPFLLARTGAVPLATHWATAWFVQSLVVCALVLDGVMAACVPWLAASVVLATLAVGWRAGLVWLVVDHVVLVALVGAQYAGVVPAPVAPAEVQWALAGLAHGGLVTVAFSLVFASVTVVERGRQELLVARAQAEEANRRKSEFLARMSHELRTPLNAIIGYAELVAEDVPPGPQADVGRIRDAGGHLLAVVNDVLDLAKVEAGHLEFRRERIAVDTLLRKVAEVGAPLAAARGNRLVVQGAGVALADELRLLQCLLNLVGNAARFTTSGEIRVTGSVTRDEVRLEVADTGVGIPPDALDRVFEPFAQVADAVPGPSGGTGLGLAIVRQYATHMGGTITAESVLGAGSRFVLTVPAG
jgi:signal transduction histidine kinase